MGSQAYKIVTENRKILKTVAERLNEFIIRESKIREDVKTV